MKRSLVDEVQTPLDSFQVYVGNVSPGTKSSELYQCFLNDSEHVINARVVQNSYSTKQKCFGFVQYDSDEFAFKAVTRFQISLRKAVLNGSTLLVRETYRPMRAELERGVDFQNGTIIFVGSLGLVTGEGPIRQAFIKFGYVESVTVIPGKGFGFVKFADHVSALAALSEMQNTEIANQRIYCTWGKMRNDNGEGRPFVRQGSMDRNQKETTVGDDYANFLVPSQPEVNDSLVNVSAAAYARMLEKSMCELAACIPSDEQDNAVDSIAEVNNAYILKRMMEFIQDERK